MHSRVLTHNPHRIASESPRKAPSSVANLANVYVFFYVKSADLFDLNQELYYFCNRKTKLIFKNKDHNYIKTQNCWNIQKRKNCPDVMSGHFFVLLFMLSVSPFCVCVCRFCRCLKVWCSATILLKRVLVWVWKTSEDGDALVSLCVLSASLCWKIFLFSCVEQNNIIFLFFCRLLSFVEDCLSWYGRQSAWRSFL